MIRLRPMRKGEFADYLAYFIPDYAAEISVNYDLDLATAAARAEAEAAASLGQGAETPGQVLLCLVKGEGEAPALGYLWCRPDADSGSVFISDFYVVPEHRGKGYGRAALNALEEMFAGPDYGELRLRVAADNPGARRLYEAAGYRVTGINMRKALDRR
jgi:ribosomal protein S18 acetylase RimI-like enzyme